ncbi:MAG: hypothetical protein SFW63_06570 [Alphaproteobacteria bacterium]|nr:hypothetical protein [Alphaproteobacteria bacterium]
MTSTHQLILTGGTLASERNLEGHLVPSATSLDGFAKTLGFTDVVKPYIIDSIDFDIDTHYSLLLKSAEQALSEHKTPLICGGTDALIWYSGMLARDLARRGYLQPGSGEKIIFLSSMKPVCDAPDLVRGILEAGKSLAAKQMSGAFAISAEYADSKQYVVHDVLNQFEKISSRLTNALRSQSPVTYISNHHITPLAAYEAAAIPAPSGDRHYARIAPPLIRGHDSKAILAYMAMIGEAHPPFDGLMVESLSLTKPLMHDRDQQHLPEMVRWLKSRGMRVVFCEHVHYDDQSKSMKPLNDGLNARSSSLRHELIKAGAEFTQGMSKDIYLDMTLTTPPRSPSSSSSAAPPPYPLKNQKVLGLRYVPRMSVMRDSVDTLAPHCKNLFFYTLPGNALPNAMAEPLKKHTQTRHWKRFEYDGLSLIDHDNRDFIEGSNHHNPYGAGKKAEGLVKTCAATPDPVGLIYRSSAQDLARG